MSARCGLLDCVAQRLGDLGHVLRHSETRRRMGHGGVGNASPKAVARYFASYSTDVCKRLLWAGCVLYARGKGEGCPSLKL